MSGGLHIGAQYFRPPNPPRGDWGRDLAQMRAVGFDTVKFWACWSWMHRPDGSVDFEELDELMDHARDAGLRVVVNTILENAPYWLERAAPHARYRDAEDRPVELGAAMNTPGGGWPGLCFDNDEPRRAAEQFVAALVERYRAHPALDIWDVWNEPHLEPASFFPERMYCYCEASLTRFRAWLRDRFDGDLDTLNRAWSRRYSSWEEVAPPRRIETYPDLIDWREFWFANLAAQLDWRAGLVRRTDRDHTVMTHVALSGHAGQLATHTLDEWTVADGVDAFGTSSFPTWLMDDDPARHAFDLETARDAAAGKPFWQAELQGGRGRRHGAATTPHPLPADIALWMWSALAAGAKGIVFWQWRPELLGPESPGYGLCAPDGSLTERARLAGAMARLCDRVPALASAQPVQPRVGIMLSRRTALLAHATEGTIALYANAVLGTHRLFFDADVATCFLHADRVEREGVPPGVEIVYWPLPSVATRALARRLAAFAQAGGTLVAEAGPGQHDPSGRHATRLPGAGLDELFGARIHESDHSEDMTLETEWGALEATWQLDRLEPAGGRVVGRTSSGAPAAIRHVAGRGTATLIGSHPSLAYTARRDGATRATIVALTGAEVAGPVAFADPRPGRFHRVLRSPASEIVIAVNRTGEAAALDAAGQIRAAHLVEGHADALTVPPRAGMLIELA